MMPMYLSPMYGRMRETMKQMMPTMTARVILVLVQGRLTVSSWFPHFEHLEFRQASIETKVFRLLVMELFEAFNPEWEKGAWKQAADTGEKPENHFANTNVNTNTYRWLCKYKYK